MTKKSKLFGQMLSIGIYIISLREGKTISGVQNDLGDLLSLSGRTVEKMRQGNVPSITDVETLANQIIKRSGGYLSRTWLERFLQTAYYPEAEKVCNQLFPRRDMVTSSDQKPSIYVVIGALIEEKADRFVGREYVFTAIEEFLQRHDRGYFTIEGDPGMGKSAILAKYVQDRGCLNHFNIRLAGINRTEQFLENICTQLITRYGLPYSELPAEATRDGVFFADLLTQVSKRLKKGEPLVIAIDALDEIDRTRHPPSVNILYLPPVVPKGVYFVMTRRRMPDLPLAFQVPQEIYNLLDHQTESQRDIKRYIRREIDESASLRSQIGQQGLKNEEFVSLLTGKSEYNFMYLYYVLPEITLGAYRHFAIEKLPIGLEGYNRERRANQHVLQSNAPLGDSHALRSCHLAAPARHLAVRVTEKAQQEGHTTFCPRAHSPPPDAKPRPLALSPFQAPPELPYFTGRQAEVKALKKALGDKDKPLCLIGMGGVGKTSLAIHLAYQLRETFPDGVLWVQVEHSDTMSLLRVVASAYQVDVSQYTDLGSRSSKVRELLADKRALIVLDNAERDEDVSPLLPPTGECAVIITTRHHDLVVADNSHRFHIKPFSREKEEALALLAHILGSERTQKEYLAMKEIADLLGHLPLAIAIAANRMKHEPGWSAASFLRRIKSQRRLTELARGNLAVRLSFDLSYHALPPDLQQFFATLGLFERQDFSVAAVAYIATLPLEEAEDKLRHLYSLSLVQAVQAGRYNLHPLLRDYSREKLTAGLERGQERMVTFFVDYMERHKRDYAALDLERNNLFAALEIASSRGMKTVLVRGAIASYDFLQARGLYERAKMDLSRAEQAAKEIGDLVGLAAILRNLGRIANKQARYSEAQKLFEQALTLARQTENLVPFLTLVRKEGQAQISALLTSLGALAHRRSNYVQAKAYYDEAITLAKQAADKPRLVALQTNLALLAAEQGHIERAESIYKEALQLVRQLDDQKRLTTILLQNLGGLMHDRGQYEQAKKYFQEGLTLAKQIGEPELRSRLLANLGLVSYASQDYPAAGQLFKKSLELAQENQLPQQISRQLANLGLVATALKNYQQANQHYQKALTLARQSDFPKNICRILSLWGECHLAQQNLPEAEACFCEALETAQAAKLQQEIAKSSYGLARIAAKHGNISQARQLGQQSQDIFEAAGHKRAPNVRQWLWQLPE